MTPTEKLHAAAKIIRADGCEGIYAASRMVGYETALGMLILHLRINHNRRVGWPDADDSVAAVDAILRREGLLSTILFSPSLGRGVVYDESGPLYAVQVEKMYQPESAAGLHIGMWLQGASPLTVVPAGPHPFRQGYDEMQRLHRELMDEHLRSLGLDKEG